MNILTALIFILSAALLQCCKARDQSELAQQQPVDDALQEARFTAPFRDMVYRRVESDFDTEVLDFSTSFVDGTLDLGGRRYPIKLRQRGGVRFCDSFPHFKIKAEAMIPAWAGKTFKLVSNGQFHLDATPVVAPACENKLNVVSDDRYAKEFAIYQMAEQLLDYHLKVVKFAAAYIDATEGLIHSDQTFAIEDDKQAARRLGASVYHPEWLLLHTNATDVDFGDTFLGLKCLQEYSLIAQKMPAPAKPIGEFCTDEKIAALKMKHQQEIDPQRQGLAKLQLDLRSRSDLKAIVDVVLFNTMIGNTDWNYLGITRHSNAIKNVEIVQKDGQLIPIPYDFNDTRIWFQESSAADYQESLLKTLTSFADNQTVADRLQLLQNKIRVNIDKLPTNTMVRRNIDQFLAVRLNNL